MSSGILIIIISILFFIYFFNKDKNDLMKTAFIRTVKFVDFKEHKIPIIEIELNSKKRRFILDTGSNLNLIKKEFLENSEININSADIKVDNDIITLSGVKSSNKIIEIQTTIEERNKTLDFSIVEGLNFPFKSNPIGILGNDFIEKFNIVIDYKNKCIYL